MANESLRERLVAYLKDTHFKGRAEAELGADSVFALFADPNLPKNLYDIGCGSNSESEAWEEGEFTGYARGLAAGEAERAELRRQRDLAIEAHAIVLRKGCEWRDKFEAEKVRADAAEAKLREVGEALAWRESSAFELSDYSVAYFRDSWRVARRTGAAFSPWTHRVLHDGTPDGILSALLEAARAAKGN